MRLKAIISSLDRDSKLARELPPGLVKALQKVLVYRADGEDRLIP